MSNETNSDDNGLDYSIRPDVSALASTVIAMLNGKSGEKDGAFKVSAMKKLLHATLRDVMFDPEQVRQDLARERIDVEKMIDVYIPECARELGRLWDQDHIGFAKVTIGSARLQTLLSLIAPAWSEASDDAPDMPCIHLVLLAGETHTLGPHVATAQLRRLGASVRVDFGRTASEVEGFVRQTDYDMVMFSCSRPENLETVSKLVKRVRQRHSKPPLFALGGHVLGTVDHLMERTGVDIVAADVKSVFRLCMQVKQKKKQRHDR